MIAVVVPIYNEGEGLFDWVNKLLEEQNIEQCIIVDASQDDVAKINQQRVQSDFLDPPIQYVIANKKGRAYQMNQGAQLSLAPYLLFLHADTNLPENAIEQIQAGLEAGWHWGRFDVEFSLNQSGACWPYKMITFMMNWRSRQTGIATGDQAIFMTRAAFDLVGGFDEIELMEDIALSKKLKGIGAPLCLEAKVETSARRWEQKGVFKTIGLMWWLRLAYFVGVSPKKINEWYR